MTIRLNATDSRASSSCSSSSRVRAPTRSRTLRAYVSMSSKYTDSTLFDILNHQIVLDIRPDRFAHAAHHVDLAPAEDLGKFALSIETGQSPRRAVRRVLHQHIHVAPRRVEVVPHHRPEERQLADAPLPAELGDPVVGNGDGELARGRHVLHFTGPGLILTGSAVMVSRL